MHIILHHFIALTSVLSCVQAGAAVNVTAGGATPLHIGADLGSPEILNRLLEAGADCNVTDEVRLLLHSVKFF